MKQGFRFCPCMKTARFSILSLYGNSKVSHNLALGDIPPHQSGSPSMPQMNLVLLFFVSSVFSATLDIHLVIPHPQETSFLKLNKYLRQLDPNNQVNFSRRAQPHITLYLTDFQDQYISQIYEHISKWIRTVKIQCFVAMDKPVINGAYGMWFANNTNCIHQLSNSLVTILSPYIVPNQPIPSTFRCSFIIRLGTIPS